VVLIDIGSSFVSGAYARVKEGSNPVLHYTARVPIQARGVRASIEDMERALVELSKALLVHGAPVLTHATGSGSVDRVLVSIAAPWQETRTHTQRINRSEPFRFTRHVMDEMVARASVSAPGYTQANHLVLATFLNGYEVHEPLGKMARSAQVIVLSSSVSDKVLETVMSLMRGAFHTRDIEFTAFVPVAYTVLRALYPHEEDFLIMDISGEATDLALVRQGLLVETVSIPYGVNIFHRVALTAGVGKASPESLKTVNEVALVDLNRNHAFTKKMEEARDTWLTHLADAFHALTTRYALPRTVLLLADEEVLGFITTLLNTAPGFQKLWLAEESIPIIAIKAEQLASSVTYRNEAQSNIFLSFLALYTTYSFTAARTRHP